MDHRPDLDLNRRARRHRSVSRHRSGGDGRRRAERLNVTFALCVFAFVVLSVMISRYSDARRINGSEARRSIARHPMPTVIKTR